MSVFGYARHWSATLMTPSLRVRMVRGNSYFIPEFADVITPNNALAAFEYLKTHGGPATGIDGIGFGDISRAEVAACFRVLRPIILAGDYRLQPTRVVEIAKRSGGTRELRIQVLLDRIIARMAYEAIGECIDRLFVPWSYGFRPRKSTWHLLADMKLGAEIDGLFITTTDDIRKAFDNVPIEPLLETLGDVLPDHRYWELIAAVVRKRNSDGKEKKEGIDQGNALSPFLLNLYLHMHLDILLFKEVTHPSRMSRYADNVGHQTRDAREGRRLLEVTDRLLKQAGLNLKGFNSGQPEELLGTPTDLRERMLPLLGFNLSAKENRTLLSVQESAWKELTEELEQAHSNPNPPERTREIIRGWISAIGPALDYRLESVSRRIINHLRETNLQGSVPKDALFTWAKGSLASWHRVLQSARKSYECKC